jgi:hypothetical protein
LDDSKGSKSSLSSITAMARLTIIRNLSRRASADWGEVCGTGIRRAEVSSTLRLDSAGRMLLLVGPKVVGLVLLFGASDGDFMVVTVVGLIACSK